MNAAELMHAEPHTTQNLAAWIATEKYDGHRALWSEGQLWTRQGNSYHAPPWFTAGLPDMVLDGELFAGYGMRDTLANISRAADPERWRSLRFVVFDTPSPLPYLDRLASIAGKLDGCPYAELVQPRVLQSTADGWQWTREIVARGGEGVVAHDWRRGYRPGRQIYVVKLKFSE